MTRQNTAIQMKQSINCKGKLVDLSRPKVMGILNMTPDSFHDGGQYNAIDDLLHKAESHLEGGAYFLDIGAVSSRPGADDVSEQEELKRLMPAIDAIIRRWPDAMISVDTFRSNVAKTALEAGTSIINDISAGRLDAAMFETVQTMQAPYIMMHMQGKPKTMQEAPSYQNVLADVLSFFIDKVNTLKKMGVHDIIIDPGFGFGKTVEHNYALLRSLSAFELLELPLLVGLSRKSMINSVLETQPETALNGTTALHMAALQNGASILRVHDSKEATECIKLWHALNDVAA